MMLKPAIQRPNKLPKTDMVLLQDRPALFWQVHVDCVQQIIKIFNAMRMPSWIGSIELPHVNKFSRAQIVQGGLLSDDPQFVSSLGPDICLPVPFKDISVKRVVF